jgi:hypothetical protein
MGEVDELPTFDPSKLVEGWFPDGEVEPSKTESEDERKKRKRKATEDRKGPDPFEDRTGQRHHYRHRAYDVSELPALPGPVGTPDSNESALRLSLLGETIGVWKQLVDIRFRLLALVPIASLVALAVAADKVAAGGRSLRLSLAGLALVGLVVTAGLCVYDRRNTELHNDLVSRIRRLEAELGVHTGIMRGRLDPTRRLVQHGTATKLIYGASAVAWLGAAVIMAVAASVS